MCKLPILMPNRPGTFAGAFLALNPLRDILMLQGAIIPSTPGVEEGNVADSKADLSHTPNPDKIPGSDSAGAPGNASPTPAGQPTPFARASQWSFSPSAFPKPSAPSAKPASPLPANPSALPAPACFADEDPPLPSDIPAQLGPYRIERILAQGGMGEVLLGIDSTLHRPVAIKRMAKTLLEDSDAKERFKREARATAAVSHPNIAGIYFVGADDEGLPYLAMEYVDGKTLGQLLRERRPVAASVVCDWIIQACEGLQAAFKAEIIHRDLKPANLMITHDGVLKIVDFGLAKISRENIHKTQTGMVVGTPQYMSPEQGQGRVLDHRSDIYSLGAAFYHFLSGRPPFEGNSMLDVMMKHVTAPLVPLYSVNPQVPLPLCDIIHRMMSKNPAERPQDYEELLGELKAVKLHLLTREKGAFVTGAMHAPDADASASPDPDDPNADLRAIVAGTLPSARSKSIPPCFLKEHHPLAPDEDPRPRLLTPRQFLWIGFATLAGLLVIVTLLIRNVQTRSDDPAARPSSGLAMLLQRVLAPQAQATPTPVPPDLLAARKTRLLLTEISHAVEVYEGVEKEFPESVQDLVRAELVAPESILDGWQQEILLNKTNHRVISFGGDGREGTPDDFIVEAGNSAPMPQVYRDLELKYTESLMLPNGPPRTPGAN